MRENKRENKREREQDNDLRSRCGWRAAADSRLAPATGSLNIKRYMFISINCQEESRENIPSDRM